MITLDQWQQSALFEPDNPGQQIQEHYTGLPGGYTSFYWNRVPVQASLEGSSLGAQDPFTVPGGTSWKFPNPRTPSFWLGAAIIGGALYFLAHQKEDTVMMTMHGTGHGLSSLGGTSHVMGLGGTSHVMGLGGTSHVMGLGGTSHMMGLGGHTHVMGLGATPFYQNWWVLGALGAGVLGAVWYHKHGKSAKRELAGLFGLRPRHRARHHRPYRYHRFH